MDDTKYEIMSSFIHCLSHEKMYRVKRIFSSGGLDFIVCNDEQLKLLGIVK